MPKAEIHFFDKDFNYSKGVDWYERHFAEAGDEKAVGEKTPDYCWAEGQGGEGHRADVHKSIRDVLPDAKLIVALKNPVDRAVSAVKHIIRSGRISPFHRIDDLLVGDQTALLEGYGVIEVGRVYTRLNAYLELFEADQVLVLIFEEDIVQNPSQGLRKVCTFLEIDPFWEFTDIDQKANPFDSSKFHLILRCYFPFLSPLFRRLEAFWPAATYRPDQSTIQHLYGLYEEENRKLFELLKREPPKSWFQLV